MPFDFLLYFNIFVCRLVSTHTYSATVQKKFAYDQDYLAQGKYSATLQEFTKSMSSNYLFLYFNYFI